jgi:hypothetical protein
MHRLRFFSIVSGVAVAASAGVGLPLLGSTVAGAAGPGAVVAAPGGAGPQMSSDGVAVTTGNAKATTNVAGYGVGSTGTPATAPSLTSIDGSVVVPALSCPTTGYYKSDVSLQILRRSDTTTTPDRGYNGGSFITLTCTAGVASYSGLLGLATFGSKTFAVAAGNTITTDISLTSATGYTAVTMTATNQTTGVVTRKIIRKKKVVVDNAGWAILQRLRTGKTPFPFYDVPPFGTLNFSGVTVNGAALSAATPQKYYMEEGTKTKVELVQAKPIDATGSAFTDKFLKSS